MYANGQGVPQDYVEAVVWYRKATDQGHAGAQNNLGVMYDDGQGVAKDAVSAHMWFNLSAARGTESAATNRDDVATKMTPAQIADAQQRASAWSAAFEQRGGK
jgi:TPR repeat protein